MLKYKLRIKHYRMKKRLTLKQLSKKIGISENYLCELENNKYDIKLSCLIKISEELDVCIGQLIDFPINNRCIKGKITTLKSLNITCIWRNSNIYKVVVLLLLVLNLFC